MELKTLQTNGELLAVTLGLFEGIVFAVMSTVCILIYFLSLKSDEDIVRLMSSDYMGTLGKNFYIQFLRYDQNSGVQGYIMSSTTFDFFMWVCALLHITWIGTSLQLRSKRYPSILFAWGVCALVISAWDFITYVILAADYEICLQLAKYDVDHQGYCANTILPVFVMAAKGFTLWLINIVLGVFAVLLGRNKNV